MTYIVYSCPLPASHPSSQFPFVKYLLSHLFVAAGKFLLSQWLLLICHWSNFQHLLAAASCCLPLCGNCRAAPAHSSVWRGVSSEMLGETQNLPFPFPFPDFSLCMTPTHRSNHTSATVLGKCLGFFLFHAMRNSCSTWRIIYYFL